jgi:uncharacterized protein YrrD
MNSLNQSNLIKGKDLINLKVLTLQDGKLIKNVDELVFDPMANQVRALVVDPKGWFSDAEVILFEDIKNIGRDSIVVESEDVIKKASDVQEKISRIIKDDNYLTDNKVMTEDGNELGKISDIYFDPHTGNVIELEVSQGTLKSVQSGKKRVRVSDVIRVGEDATIVKGFVEETLENQAQHQGLQGVVTTAQAKAPGAIEQAKQKLNQLGQTVKEETEELTAQAKQKVEEVQHDPDTQQTIATIQSKAMEAKMNLEQKLSQAKDQAQVRVQQSKQEIQE